MNKYLRKSYIAFKNVLPQHRLSPLSKWIQRRFNAYFSKPKQGTLELPLYSWALGPWSRLWHQENMFGKRNVQQAFTSRYLSSEVGWTREGGGRVAGAARLCHGRSRKDRHEPVLAPIPVLRHCSGVGWRSSGGHLKARSAQSPGTSSHRPVEQNWKLLDGWRAVQKWIIVTKKGKAAFYFDWVASDQKKYIWVNILSSTDMMWYFCGLMFVLVGVV